MKINFPLQYKQVDTTEDLLSELATSDILSQSRKILVVTGEFKSFNIAKTILPIKHKHKTDIYSCADFNSDYEQLESLITAGLHDTIVSIGGGMITDLGKRLSLLHELKYISIPTIISNDGLISPIAVLRQSNRNESLPGKMPDVVLLANEIINSAPKKYMRAAALDLMSNISATNDWDIAFTEGSEPINHLAYHLSRTAAFSVIDCRDNYIGSPSLQRSIISGQIYSGIAMGLAGTSRPCSGAEHLLAHAMDYLDINSNMLHGEKVGVTTRFTLFLQKADTRSMDHLWENFGLQKQLCVHNQLDDCQLRELFETAFIVRPGRITVLYEKCASELVEQYHRYIESKV